MAHADWSGGILWLEVWIGAAIAGAVVVTFVDWVRERRRLRRIDLRGMGVRRR
jgi:hypothetical protein